MVDKIRANVQSHFHRAGKFSWLQSHFHRANIDTPGWLHNDTNTNNGDSINLKFVIVLTLNNAMKNPTFMQSVIWFSVLCYSDSMLYVMMNVCLKLQMTPSIVETEDVQPRIFVQHHVLLSLV